MRWLSRGRDALILATFSVERLDALTAARYQRLSIYHSEVHNRHGLFPWEKELIDAHFPPSGTVLVTSAGGGREVLALLESGRRVVASDCVPSLLAELERRAGGRAAVHLAPPDQLPPGRFDAALVGWAAYSHLPGRERRIDFLRRLSRALPSGAPILLSYFLAPEGHSRGARAAVLLANLVPFHPRPVEPGDSTLTGWFMRSFLPGEAAAEARAAGLIDPREQISGEFPHLIARTA